MAKFRKVYLFLFVENFHKKQEKSGRWTSWWSHAWHGRGEGKDLFHDSEDDGDGDDDDGDDDDTSKIFMLGPQQREKCMVSTGITGCCGWPNFDLRRWFPWRIARTSQQLLTVKPCKHCENLWTQVVNTQPLLIVKPCRIVEPYIYGSRSVYPGLKCQAYKSTNKCQIAATNCKTMQNVTLVLHDDSDTTSWYKPCEIFNPCETIWLYKICVKKCEMWFSVHITLIANTGRVSSLNSEKLRLCLWCQSPENTDKKYTFSFVNHRNVLNWIWRS